MTEEQKKQTTNVEGVQEMIRKAVNKTGGNVGSCSTAGNTAANEVTLGPAFNLVAGAVVVITFVNGITVNGATLAITYTDLAGTTTTTDAKPIYYRGAALGKNLVKANMIVQMKYNANIVTGTDSETGDNITGAWEVVGDLTPSGFVITTDETTGTDIFTAVGSAMVSHNDETGADEFVF